MNQQKHKDFHHKVASHCTNADTRENPYSQCLFQFKVN